MELLLKTAIGAIIVVALVAAAFLGLSYFGVKPGAVSTETQAANIVVYDLKQHAPAANISILNVSPSIIHNGSWSILTRTIYNQDSACPSVITQQFDYPATGLLNTTIVYTNYSRGVCDVYLGLSNRGGLANNIVGLAAVAIATPYNTSLSPLVDYIDDYGYNNTHASARFLSSYNMSNSTLYSVWLINYTAINAAYSYYVILNRSGSIVDNYT